MPHGPLSGAKKRLTYTSVRPVRPAYLGCCMDQTTDPTDAAPPGSPPPLEYPRAREPARTTSAASRFASRLGRPMPLGMLALILLALSVLASALVIGFFLLLDALR